MVSIPGDKDQQSVVIGVAVVVSIIAALLVSAIDICPWSPVNAASENSDIPESHPPLPMPLSLPSLQS